MQPLGMIFAHGVNGSIGNVKDIVCHLPEELTRFEELTLGHPIIMGQGTWESLPEVARLRPGSCNIVLSHNPRFASEGAIFARTVNDALFEALIRSGEMPWVLGCEVIHSLFMPRASELAVTRVGTESLDLGSCWRSLGGEQSEYPTESGVLYSFEQYRRSPSRHTAPRRGSAETGPLRELAPEGGRRTKQLQGV